MPPFLYLMTNFLTQSQIASEHDSYINHIAANHNRIAHLHHIAAIDVKLVDLLVAAAAEQHVLLVLVGVQLGDVEHLAGTKGADDLRQPQLLV